MSRTALIVAAYVVVLGVPALQLGLLNGLLKAPRPRTRAGQARALIRAVQHLDEAAFITAYDRRACPRPVPPRPSRMPDRATVSCVGFGLFVLGLIGSTVFADDVPWGR